MGTIGTEKKTFRILIVDDEEQIIDILRLNFERKGYICDWAYNGEEALQKITKNPPDLLITDIKMPQMDGLELIERLRAEGSEIPIVVITAFFDIENAIQALRLGAVNFFKKPFDFQAIHDTVFKIKNMSSTRVEKDRALDFLETANLRFSIPSDIELIDGVSSYITDRAVELGIISPKQKFYIQLALDEVLSNAVMHGNLCIQNAPVVEGEEIKTRDELYQERSCIPELASRKVFINATVDNEKLRVTVRDEGEGFDISLVPDPTDNENVFRYHGRGIFVIRNIMDDIVYNEKGNQVTITKYSQGLRRH